MSVEAGRGPLLRGWELVSTVGGLVGALCLFGVLPRPLLAYAVLPLLLGGWARPLLARAGPAHLDRLKLGAYALALSPPLGLLVWLVCRLVWPKGEAGLEGALGTSLVLGALLQAASPRGRRVSWGGGSSAALVLALALLLALGVGLLVLSGNAVRLSHHGLLHSAILLASDRGLPPGNPWMAGAPLAYYWAWHVLGAYVARCLWVAPTVALAWTNVWAMGLCAVFTWLLAAGLLKRARLEFLALFLALFGLNLIGGFKALLGPAWPAAPADAGAVLEQLREVLVGREAGQLRFDPRLAFALSKFGNLSSYPAALALGLGGLVAALQALGSGGRLWRVLCGSCLGLSLALNPLVGAPWIGLVGLAALIGGRGFGQRVDLPLALLLSALPGLWLLQSAAQDFSGPLVALELDPGRWAAAARPLWPLILLAVLGCAVLAGRVRSEHPDWKRRRGPLLLALLLGFGPLVAGALFRLPYENQYKFVRAAGWCLPLLAAPGLGWLIERGKILRGLGLSIGALLLVGSLGNLWFGARAYAALAGRQVPLEERPLALLPRADGDLAAALGGGSRGAAQASDAATRRAAYAFLRADPRVRAQNPVLFVDVARPAPGLWAAPGGPPMRFLEPDNLQGHEAAAFAALDLFVDRPSQALDAHTPGARSRLEFVSALFDSRQAWDDAVTRTLEALDRPLLLLLGEAERRRDLKLPQRLEQFGWVAIWSQAGALIYAWPGSFAAPFQAPTR